MSLRDRAAAAGAELNATARLVASRDESATVRAGAPEGVVTQLVHDRSSQVRWCLAFYRKHDRRALELLAADTHADVRSQALGMLRDLGDG